MKRMKAILPPKANEQHNILGRILVAIGLCAVATVMWMTGRFGWSLQEEVWDKWVSAGLHVLNDAAGAGLVITSSIMLGKSGWANKAGGMIAMLCALLLVTYSIVSVYGFMSTRVMQLESHNRVVAHQQGELDWKRKTSVNREVPKADRLMMRAETHMASKKLEDSLRFIPDRQAVSIAALFSTTVERVQRTLVIVTSGVGQLIKVACLFFGFWFLSCCSEGGPSSKDGSGASAGHGQVGEVAGGGLHPAYSTQVDRVVNSGTARAGGYPLSPITSVADRHFAAMGPLQAEVRPAQAEVRSAQAEVGPAQAEVRPAQAEVRPVQAEVRPAQAEVGPAQAEVGPAQAEVRPVQAEARPARAEARQAQPVATSIPWVASGKKLTRDQVNDLLGLVVSGRLSLSTHEIARQTGWPRSTIRDMLGRMAGINAALGKFARLKSISG
jgi:hypothetical protein